MKETNMISQGRRPLKHLFVVFAFVSLLGISVPAWGQWSVRVNGPDVFGTTTVLAAVDSNQSQNGFVVQCRGEDSLFLAYILPATPSELDAMSKPGSSVPAELLVKVDNGPVEKLGAQLRQWNAHFLGIVAEGRTADIAAAVRAVGTANGTINVGADILGAKQADSFDAQGSTAAMNTVVKDCKLDDIDTGSPDGTKSAR
jgi:hypothetical protein